MISSVISFSSDASLESGRRWLRLRPLGAARLQPGLLRFASALVVAGIFVGAPSAQETEGSDRSGARHYEARWRRPPACELGRAPVAGERFERGAAQPDRIWQAGGEGPPCRLAPNAAAGLPYGFPLGIWVDGFVVPGRPPRR